jgi:hypothetical protein
MQRLNLWHNLIQSCAGMGMLMGRALIGVRLAKKGNQIERVHDVNRNRTGKDICLALRGQETEVEYKVQLISNVASRIVRCAMGIEIPRDSATLVAIKLSSSRYVPRLHCVRLTTNLIVFHQDHIRDELSEQVCQTKKKAKMRTVDEDSVELFPEQNAERLQ